MGAMGTAASHIPFVRRLVGVRERPVMLASVPVVIVLFELAISDGGRHGPTLSLAQVAIYLAAAGLLAAGVFRWNAVTAAVTAVTGVAAVTALWSVRPEATIRQVLLWLLYLGLVAVTGSALRSSRAVQWFADSVVVTAGWLSLVGLFMFWGAGNPGMRWYSTFYWPNPFAAFLLLALPIEVLRYVHASRRDALAHGSLSVLLAVSFVLTYSRGGWLSLLTIVPVAAFVLRPPSWLRAAGRTLILTAGVAAAVIMLTRGAAPVPGQEVLNRAASVADTGDLSIQGRLTFWRSAWAIFLDHPLGTGAGTFGAVHAAYQRDVRFYAADAHNLYLQTAAEMGVPGLIALAALLGTTGVVWLRTLRQARDTDLYPVVAGAGLALLAFFVHSAIEMNWMFPANPAMAFALAGMLAASDQVMSGDAAARRIRTCFRLGGALVLCLAAAAVVLGWAAQQEYVGGQRFARAGNWSEAARVYRRAERWNPLQPRYPGARATALMQTIPPDPDAAEAALRRAMALDRMNAAFPLQLALMLSAQPAPSTSALREAEGLLHRALALDRYNRPDAYRALAALYRRQGRMRDADQVYRDAASVYLGKELGRGSLIYTWLWPQVVDLVLEAGDFADGRGDRARAIRLMQALLAEDPGSASAALRLGTYYMKEGQVVHARAVLEAAAARNPGVQELRALLERLP